MTPSCRGWIGRRVSAHVVLASIMVAVFAGGSAAVTGVASSPDGRIAFTGEWGADALNADLYRVDVASGQTVNLTRTELASERSAAISPDGTSIVFVVSRFPHLESAIWRMNADGSGRRRVASGHSPAWSPDGRWLAYVRDGIVFTAAADGSGERRLADGASPGWSPDGRSIALVVHGTPRSSVLVAAADGTSIRTIYAEANNYEPVAWSPDGAHIFVRTGGSLAIVPVSGGDVRTVAGAGGTVSPDGSRIAFVKLGPTRIYVMPIAGGEPVAVSNPWYPYGDHSPQWSPDGNKILFVRGQDTKHGLQPIELRVVPAEGGATRRVANFSGSGSDVVWAGSGSLVYSRRSNFNSTGVISVRSDGTGRRRLALGGREPAFSPDGRSIAFVRPVDGQSELFVMDADGAAVRRLTDWPSHDHSPSWSPDGSRIVFVRQASSEESALYTIRPDGTHLAALRAPRSLWSPAWSPDGRTIAAGQMRFGRRSLVTVATETGRVHELVTSADVETLFAEPAWHPSGERLSFVRTSYCKTAGCGGISVDLWTIGRRGEAPRLLLRRVAEAAWSDDGKRLVVTEAPSRAMRIHASGGKVLRKLPVSGTGVTWQPRCTVSGTQGADRLSGIGASALVCGLGGDDRLAGGPGRDRLFGGDGNDAIVTRGGGFDVVGCGPGADAVHADRTDYVGVDCERVTRR